VIASVHIADVGARSALEILRRAPRADSIRGLRQANVAIAAPLSQSRRPPPDLGRVALIAFWDDDDDLDRFLATHRLAARLGEGWHARLEPVRRWGSWPGLPDSVTTTRAVDQDGPLAVLTLGRLRLTQTVRFLRVSGKAEASALASPGLIWATALARPPFVATCSLWSATRALSTYAYGQRDPGHPDAIAAHAQKPFHHESAFIRFRPYGSEGALDGRNPLPANWMDDERTRAG
jgi:hypothetical protein